MLDRFEIVGDLKRPESLLDKLEANITAAAAQQHGAVKITVSCADVPQQG